VVRADVDGESIGQLPMPFALLPLRITVAANRAAPEAGR
jgi:diacylglycerol kinase (ATP)